MSVDVEHVVSSVAAGALAGTSMMTLLNDPPMHAAILGAILTGSIVVGKIMGAFGYAAARSLYRRWFPSEAMPDVLKRAGDK